MNSDLNNVRIITEDIINYLLDYFKSIDENTLFEIKVIINELFTNAVKHGNKDDINKSIKVCARIIKNRYFALTMEDEGKGNGYFPYNNMKFNGTVGFEDLKECGRGILIIKNICERIKYSFTGNKVFILKKLKFVSKDGALS